MSNHDELRDALRRTADRGTGGTTHPLGLEDVKGRARGIRRRRAALTGLAAAAVLAIAVPAGIVVTDQGNNGPDTGPAATPTPTPLEPGEPVLLDVEAAPSGGPAALPVLLGSTLTEPNGDTIEVGDGVRAFVPLGDGWVVTRQRSVEDITVDRLDAEGTVIGSDRGSWGLAASEDETAVAYARPTGEVMTVSEGEEPFSLGRVPMASPEVVVMQGSANCRDTAESGRCTVYANDPNKGESWSVTSGLEASRAFDFSTVRGLAPDGRLAGIVSVSATGSCSAVVSADGSEQWRTCDYTLDAFSPDGRLILGRPAYLDGAGDASLALLRADSGELVARFQNDEVTQSFVGASAWESNDAVLATVFQGGSWHLMRLGTDGSLSRLSLAGEDSWVGTEDEYVSPLRLPSR